MIPVKTICIICASLEPGRDGVGDYTYLLSHALANRGLSVKLIALNDRFSRQPLDQDPAGDLMRIPAALPAAMRYALAQKAIDAWAPDWISVQFVNWAFGWKGIVVDETYRLRRLTTGYPLHIMFHEPWLAPLSPDDWQGPRRLLNLPLGRFQKISLGIMGRFLGPKITHTSNVFYQQMFAEIGIETGILPLYGNIPPRLTRDWPRIRQLISDNVGIRLDAVRDRSLLIGIFGTLRKFPIEAALTSILKAAQASGKRPIVFSFGHSRLDSQTRLAAWRSAVPELEFCEIGPLDNELISIFINEIDAAITPHPAHLIGRSGGAAALLEHGVPLITCWGEVAPDDVFTTIWHELIWPADATLTDRLLAPAPPRVQGSLVSMVADQMLTELGLVPLGNA